jgi:hypothetical protein
MINLMVEVVLTDQTTEEVEIEEKVEIVVVEIEEMVETVVVPMVVQIEEENN